MTKTDWCGAMPAVLIDLAHALWMVATGIAAGWWLRTRLSARTPHDDSETQRAREVLGRLHELAQHMAAHVGAHSSRVEEINKELTAADSGDPEAVVSAVARLIEANQEMQQQLDTTEEKLQEQVRLVETHAVEARTDALTGLANRRALDDELARQEAEFQQSGKTFSVIMGDVDHFKRFNDTHGHQAGDEVLRRVANVIRQSVRDLDIVARYGGEEFAVILPGTTAADAQAGAERVRQAIDAARFQYGSAELRVTASFGIAELQRNEATDAMIQRADAALYSAKKAGRNRTHWHDGQTINSLDSAPPPSHETPAEAPAAKEQGAKASPSPPSPAPSRDDAVVGHARQKGIFSRIEFQVALGRRLAEWRRGGAAPGVLLVRIDSHADLVARYGPPAWALVLRATAQFLGAAVRDMDMAAEYDEATFAMLLPGADLSVVVGVAERLRKAIANCALPSPTGPLRFSVSVAGATSTSGDEIQTLLARAEETLAIALKSGGNTSYFHTGQWSETVAATLERARASGILEGPAKK
jgi:diguanylate cyclase